MSDVHFRDFCTGLSYSWFNVALFSLTGTKRILTLLRDMVPESKPSPFHEACTMLLAEELENINKYDYPDAIAMKTEAERRKDKILELRSTRD